MYSMTAKAPASKELIEEYPIAGKGLRATAHVSGCRSTAVSSPRDPPTVGAGGTHPPPASGPKGYVSCFGTQLVVHFGIHCFSRSCCLTEKGEAHELTTYTLSARFFDNRTQKERLLLVGLPGSGDRSEGTDHAAPRGCRIGLCVPFHRHS